MYPLLSWTSFVFLSLAVLAGPWFFGAWVPWWFWPFAACLFLSILSSGIGLLVHKPAPPMQESQAGTPPEPYNKTDSLLRFAVACAAVTVLYVFIRSLQSPVRMDAERSLLLFLLPAAITLQAAFAFDARQRRWLFHLLAANLLLIGIYGIANHLITGSRLVLWAPGYDQYQIGTDRATGSYFCPDHFSGIMELGLAIGIALLMSRGHAWPYYVLGAALSVVAILAIGMSKSRGGGLTVVAMILVAVIAGFYQRSTLKRWCWRIATLAAVAILAAVVWYSEPGYVTRFKAYFGEGPLGGATWREKVIELKKRLEPIDRYQMISASLRGWKMAPVFGIGAGMHQHYWFHTAASGDGHRETNRWPTYLNTGYHSYESHSDWAQLLEEYGMVGFLLVIATAGLVIAILARDLHAKGRRWRKCGRRDVACAGVDPYAFPLAALLALMAMSVHSLGDFNLQMPATGWVLAAIAGISFARGEPPAALAAAAPIRNAPQECDASVS